MVDATIFPPNVDQLSDGYELHGRNIYRIEKYLGEGHTAVVYQAVISDSNELVAVKILRPDTSELTQGNFWNESLVLGELMNVGATMAPRLIETVHQSEEGWRFIALEFIDGKEYPAIDSLADSNFLAESEVLEFATQALDLLQRLHEQVGRTYTDMQLKNFLWNRSRQKLKVLDWNHVSLKKEFLSKDELSSMGVENFNELAQRDLRRMAAYLYKLLTGNGAYENGESRQALARRAGAAWENLNLATQQLLVIGLTPDPQRTYQTAAEFRDAVTQAAKLADPLQVKDNWKDLLVKLKDYVVKAEKAQDSDSRLLSHGTNSDLEISLNNLDQAKVILDALERANLSFQAGELNDRLKKLVNDKTGQWAVGQNFYKVDEYSEAALHWQKEALYLGTTAAWRWTTLARLGSQLGVEKFQQLRPSLEAVVQFMENGDYTVAQEQLSNLLNGQDWVDAGLTIKTDIDTALAFTKAKQIENASELDPKQGNLAAEQLRIAEKLLKQINPEEYRESLHAQGGWYGIEERAQLCEKRWHNRQENDRGFDLIQDEFHQKTLADPNKGYADDPFLKRILGDPANPIIFDMTLQFAKKAIDYPDDRVHATQRLMQLVMFGTSVRRSEMEQYLRRLQFTDGADQVHKILLSGDWNKVLMTIDQLPKIAVDDQQFIRLRNLLEDEYQKQWTTNNHLASEILHQALVRLTGQENVERQLQVKELVDKQYQRYEEEKESQKYFNDLEAKNRALQLRDNFREWAAQKHDEVNKQLIGRRPDALQPMIAMIDEYLADAGNKWKPDDSDPNQAGLSSDLAKWRSGMASLRSGLEERMRDWNEYGTVLESIEYNFSNTKNNLLNLDPIGVDKAIDDELPGQLNQLAKLPTGMKVEHLRQEIQAWETLGDKIRSNGLPDAYMQAKRPYDQLMAQLQQVGKVGSGQFRDLPAVGLFPGNLQMPGELYAEADQASQAVQKQAGLVLKECTLPVEFPGLDKISRDLDFLKKYFQHPLLNPSLIKPKSTSIFNRITTWLKGTMPIWFGLIGVLLLIGILLLTLLMNKSNVPIAGPIIATPTSTPTLTQAPTQIEVPIIPIPTEIITSTPTQTPEMTPTDAPTPIPELILEIVPNQIELVGISVRNPITDTVSSEIITYTYQLALDMIGSWQVSTQGVGSPLLVNNATQDGPWELQLELASAEATQPTIFKLLFDSTNPISAVFSTTFPLSETQNARLLIIRNGQPFYAPLYSIQVAATTKIFFTDKGVRYIVLRPEYDWLFDPAYYTYPNYTGFQITLFGKYIDGDGRNWLFGQVDGDARLWWVGYFFATEYYQITDEQINTLPTVTLTGIN